MRVENLALIVGFLTIAYVSPPFALMIGAVTLITLIMLWVDRL